MTPRASLHVQYCTSIIGRRIRIYVLCIQVSRIVDAIELRRSDSVGNATGTVLYCTVF